MKSLLVCLKGMVKVIGFVILQTAASYAMKPGEALQTSEAFGEQSAILETSQAPAKKQKTLAEVGVAGEEVIWEGISPVDVSSTNFNEWRHRCTKNLLF